MERRAGLATGPPLAANATVHIRNEGEARPRPYVALQLPTGGSLFGAMVLSTFSC